MLRAGIETKSTAVDEKTTPSTTQLQSTSEISSVAGAPLISKLLKYANELTYLQEIKPQSPEHKGLIALWKREAINEFTTLFGEAPFKDRAIADKLLITVIDSKGQPTEISLLEFFPVYILPLASALYAEREIAEKVDNSEDLENIEDMENIQDIPMKPADFDPTKEFSLKDSMTLDILASKDAPGEDGEPPLVDEFILFIKSSIRELSVILKKNFVQQIALLETEENISKAIHKTLSEKSISQKDKTTLAEIKQNVAKHVVSILNADILFNLQTTILSEAQLKLNALYIEEVGTKEARQTPLPFKSISMASINYKPRDSYTFEQNLLDVISELQKKIDEFNNAKIKVFNPKDGFFRKIFPDKDLVDIPGYSDQHKKWTAFGHQLKAESDTVQGLTEEKAITYIQNKRDVIIAKLEELAHTYKHNKKTREKTIEQKKEHEKQTNEVKLGSMEPLNLQVLPRLKKWVESQHENSARKNLEDQATMVLYTRVIGQHYQKSSDTQNNYLFHTLSNIVAIMNFCSVLHYQTSKTYQSKLTVDCEMLTTLRHCLMHSVDQYRLFCELTAETKSNQDSLNTVASYISHFFVKNPNAADDAKLESKEHKTFIVKSFQNIGTETFPAGSEDDLLQTMETLTTELFSRWPEFSKFLYRNGIQSEEEQFIFLANMLTAAGINNQYIKNKVEKFLSAVHKDDQYAQITFKMKTVYYTQFFDAALQFIGQVALALSRKEDLSKETSAVVEQLKSVSNYRSLKTHEGFMSFNSTYQALRTLFDKNMADVLSKLYLQKIPTYSLKQDSENDQQPVSSMRNQ